MIKRKNVLFLTILIIFGVTFTSWLLNSNSSSRYEFETEVIQASQKIPPISVSGTVSSPGQTPLYAKTDGVVQTVNVKAGDKVKKGQILAAMDVDESDLKRFKYLSALEKEITNDHDPYRSLQSIRKLSKSGYYNTTESEDAKTQVLRNTRDYLALQTALDDYEKRTEGKILRAPFDGIVSQINWKVGDYISAGRQTVPGATIFQPGAKLEASLEVPDEVISYLKNNQIVEISLPISRENKIAGKITNITPSVIITDKNRYFLVTAELDKGLDSIMMDSKNVESNKRDWIRLGMRVVADIYTKSQDQGIWIPRAAVDIDIPTEQVSVTMSFLNDNNTYATRERSQAEKNGTESLKQQGAHSTASTMGRAIATESTPSENRVSNIYLMNSSNKIIKAMVKVVATNQDKAFISSTNLEGYRVITHYKASKSIENILGSPQ